MNSGHYLILLISFFGVSYAQTFSSPNLYIDNTSVLTSEVSICSQTVTIVAKLTVAHSNGISSAEIPTPSLYYGNYNSTQVYEDFSQWSLETGDYYNGTYTATLTIDPSSFMAGKYGLAYGTWRTSTSSRYGYYDGALILTNECSTSIPMYHYKFEDDISNSGVGANGNGTNNYPSWSWSFTGDRFSTNKSLSLNGSMYVDLNNNLNLNTSYNQGITLSAWVYIENNTSVDSFRYIVDLTDGNSNNNWNSRVLMGLTSSSTIWLGTNHNGVLDGSQDFNVESLAVNSGEWIYVAGVWDLVNDDLTIYINGTQQNNSTDISSINSLDLSGGDSESKKIGQRVFSDSNSSGWIGKIDDVKFYNTALTSSTILNLYHANKADSVAPTVILTDTDSDNTVSNSDVVTLTATFSESMTATPTISLTGIVSDAEMTATASASIWTYTWTVSTTVTSTTATVSGTDLSGNAYAGTDSLTFTILSKSFTKTESGSFLKVLKAPNGKFLASKLSDNNSSSGYNFIYESTDLQNWSQLSLSFDTSVSRGSWYGFHKDANSVLYLATKDNGVYKSSDGSSWANTISGDIGGTGAIDITSTSSYTFLLMTGNIRGIYSSNDQTNWTKIKSDGLDMADLAVGNDNTVYSITTTKRLFESQNANTTTTNVVWSENTTAAFNSKTVVVENLNDKMHLINDEGKVYRNDSGTWNNISTIPFTTTEQAYLNQLIQTSSSDFWLGTVYNGVWYSSDAGANWINYSSVYSGTYQGIFFEGEVVVITTTEGIYTHGSVSNNYNMTVYEKFDYGELEVLEGKNGGSGWDGSWINSTSSSINKHYIMSASTYSSGGGEYKIDNRSSMTYPGLSVTGNYVGDDANQTDVTKSDYRKTYKKLGSNVYIQFLVQFNNYADADNSNAKNNYFILKEGNSEKLVIRRKNGRIYMAKTTSSSASGDLVDTGVDLKGSSAAQLVIVHIGDSKTKIWIDPNLSTFNYNSPPVEDANLSYTFEFDQINLQSQAKYLYGGPTLFDEIYIYEINNNLSPTVILSDSDSDNLVSNSDVVTITATFSESMSATPTLSLTGIVSDAEMSATASASIWTYTWTVSTTVTSTTATVSGTNLAGNAYAGTDSLTFSIDNLGPTVVLSNNSLNNRVSNTQSVTLYATFSEELDITPTISLSGITTDAAMSNGNTIVLKPNNGWTSSSGSFQDFNGSSGSHPNLVEDLVIFSYLDNASIYKNFTISSGTVSVVVKLDYKKSYSEDTGQVKLYYYDANSTLLSTDASAVLTGTSDFQNLNFQSSVPSGAVVVRLELIQINESEFWAGNYGIRYRDLEITGVDEGTVYGGNDTWSYTWTVSTTATSTTATVSATDNAGNSYTGSESMTFVIDNERPYLVSSTLSNNLRAGYISATDTNTLTVTFNEEINASTFTTSDVTILPAGYFSITEHASTDNTIFIGYLNVLSDYAGVVTITLNENSFEDLAGNTNTVSTVSYISDNTAPTVTLTHTDSDNLVSNSDVVTLTATFSESMSATPTLSLTGIVSDVEMSATASASIWTYAWTVSTTLTSTTATISGTDLAGNVYTGTESLTFTIDNSTPTLVSFTDSDTDNYVNDYTNVTLSATFSESMASSPTIKIDNGTNVILVNSASMTVSSSTSSATWTYFWDVPSGSDGTYFATVSGTDLSGNAYTGTESITFVVDNTAPLIQSVTVTNTNSKVLLTYYEPVQLYDPSYFASNFSVTKTGGTATVSYTGYSFSTTDSNTIILNITVTGEPTGDELLTVGPAGASTLIDRAGNYALAYSDSSQTSNTVYLSNTPPKFTSTTVNSNNTSITIVFSEGVTADASGTELSNTDFTLAVSGGTAVLTSANPTVLSKTDSTTYVLSTSYTTPANGSEILTVTPISSVVYDSKGSQINLSSAQSNTVQLNDQAGPTITGATIDSQNRYVDITFSEGVYATASPTTAVTSSSFTLSQSSGPSYGMTISSITTTAGANLSGGETTLRFNLGSTVKPTGQEVFAITATDSSSVVDVSGNSMTVSQTNNTFQLKPPTSGGVSPEKSTIAAAPAEMIANGINTAVITVQAKDSLGQNFLEGGYQITLFGPNGDLTTTDNQNGTYSASYTPEVITQDFQELTFGFRVADTNGTPTVILRLYLDEDADGVYNINDQCLGTDAGLEVDATGCALNQLDSDNDGVFDDLDECPDTPEFEINNVKGTPTYGELIPTVVDEKGCGASQRDTDSDGIVDTEDNCIETANPDQADRDEDGIGDVCDTDNPLPEITSTVITFVQLPPTGSIVGQLEATDPEGETLTFTQAGTNFTGVLSIAADGSITVSSGALLTFDSTYNGALLSFTVSDGENEVTASVKIQIEDAPRPPEISIITLEISEDAEVGTLVGFVEARDPMGGQIVSISLQGDGFIELVDGVLKTTQELDYETNTSHPFTITAQASDKPDAPGLIGSKSESVRVVDIPNATYTGKFFLSIFNVEDETLGAKVDHRRYFNPHNKNVGKWKVKKRISGGADADKFEIKSRASAEQRRANDPVEDENEDYLAFKTPPDFENPGDANKDNVYEVEVDYINTTDGAPEVPIVVTQTNIQVPEGKTTTIELQSQPVLPTDDTDGDGVVDVLDNSPLVANADQTDEDGDGVGDVTDDFDHDGVWNPFDSCPDTPLDELVDLNGCIIFYLPANNFSISKSEKCAGENSIGVAVVDTSVTYQVEVTGAINRSETFTAKNWSIDGLSAGVYNLCITIIGVDPNEFERCFEVTIEEMDPLIVSSFYNDTDQTVSFDLRGGSTYQITQNGKTTQTSSGKYTLQLEKGVNTISISTGIECQGLFEGSYLNSYEVKYAPNPFKEQLQLYIGGKDRFIELGVYTSNGQLIDYQNIILPFGVRQHTLNTASYKQGVYIIKIKGETLDQSIQVIKE